MKSYLLVAVLLVGLGSLAKAQYVFGSAVSSGGGTESYNSGTQTFSYTDSNTVGDDNSYVPLQGSGAAFVSLTSSWHATLTVSVGASTLNKSAGNSPQYGGALALIATEPDSTVDFASISLSQNNNTGDSGNSDVPTNFYGTLSEFEVDANGNPQTTTPLGSAGNYSGTSYSVVNGGFAGSATTESVIAETETLMLTYNASTELLTGSLNGTAIGSFSLTGLPAGSTLNLAVGGFSGEGVAVTSGLVTANSFAVAPEPPVWLLMIGGVMALFAFRRLAGQRA